jgi:hypothetical protein
MCVRWKDFQSFTIGVIRSVEIFELAELRVWEYVWIDSFMKTDEYKIYAVRRNWMCARFCSFLSGGVSSVSTLCSRTVCCCYWNTWGNPRCSSVCQMFSQWGGTLIFETARARDLWRSIYVPSTYIGLSDRFRSGIHTFLTFSVRPTCSTHLILLYFVTLIFGKEYELRRLLFTILLLFSVCYGKESDVDRYVIIGKSVRLSKGVWHILVCTVVGFVGIATGDGLDHRGIGVRVPVCSRVVST